MATIRDRYVLDVDTRGAQRSISGLKAALGTLAGAFAINEIAQLGRDIVSVGLEFERFETILTTLTGSQQAARQELERLQELSKRLPQDVADINRAFVILERNGISTTTESLEGLSNVAATNARSLEQVAEATADALTGEFERLKEFGIRVSQEGEQISVRLGNSFLGSVNNGRELVDLLVELGNTRYGDAAEINADTLGQSLSNLRGAASIASSEFTQGLRPALKEVADEITNLLEQNDELARQFGVDVGEAIRGSVEAVKILAENFELLRAALIGLVSVQAVRFFLGVGQTIRGLAENFREARNDLRDLNRQMDLFDSTGSRAGGVVSGAFRNILRFINPVTAAIGTAATLLALFSDESVRVGNTTTTVGEIVSAVWNAVKNLFVDLYELLSVSIPAAFNTVVESAVQVAQPVISVFDTIGTFLRNAVNTWIGYWVGLYRTIVALFTDLPNFFVAVFRQITTSVDLLIEQSKTRFKEYFDFIKSFGDDPIEGIISNPFDTLSQGLDGVEALPSVDWDQIFNTDYLGQISEGIGGTLESLILNYREQTAALRENTEVQEDNNSAKDQSIEKTQEQIAHEERLLAIKRSQERTEEIIAEIKQRTADNIQDRQLDGLRGINRELKQIEIAELRAARAAKERLKEQLAPGQAVSIIQPQLDAIDAATRRSIEAQQEAAQAAYENSRRFSTGWKNAFDEYQENATNAARTAERLFETTTRSMEDSIVGFVKTGKFEFKDLINTILEELLRSQIRQLIAQTFGAFGGGSGGGLGGAIDTFAGFFANGGTIPAGQFGVVGERGPELVSGPAQVTPNAGSTNVTYNINAVDANSFKQMVARDPEFIYAVTERGRKSVPQTRR